MVQRVVELTEEQAEKLDELSRQMNVPAQELLHNAVDALLRTPITRARPTDEQRRRALAIGGKYRSGLTDLSLNHDKYWAEAIADEWKPT